MRVDQQSKSRAGHPTVSTKLLPPGYRWQDEVLRQANPTPERFPTTTPNANIPIVRFGTTLVFRMIKPLDWDTLDEPAKWLKKRNYLCERYGAFCFTFLEDPEAFRNELGRIIVAPKDYYALWEVQSVSNVEKQYRNSMLLLEEGLRMELDSFLELKRTLGVCWTNFLRPANKRPRDETSSQARSPDSNGEFRPGHGFKRVCVKPPTPVLEPELGPKQSSSPFGNLSLSDKQKFCRSLFPATACVSNACKVPPRKPYNYRPYTTIRRTKFAKRLQRLQALQSSPQVQLAHFRLCGDRYGQGKRDAIRAEGMYMKSVLSAFSIVIEVFSRLGCSCGLENDRVIEILGHCIRCAGDMDLTSDAFTKAKTALRWSSLYEAHLKTWFKRAKAEISPENWTREWEGDEIAKIELLQHVQNHGWVRFLCATAKYKQVMVAKMRARMAA